MELFNYEDIVQRYYNKTLKDKMQSALQTDFINNQGAVAYLSGDTQLAIKKFQEALEIMPVNDDALINLCRCYTKIGNYKKSLEQLEKLYYLEKTNKSKLIAYCLVMLLLEDFDIYGASVYFSNIKTILKENIDQTLFQLGSMEFELPTDEELNGQQEETNEVIEESTTDITATEDTENE